MFTLEVHFDFKFGKAYSGVTHFPFATLHFFDYSICGHVVKKLS